MARKLVFAVPLLVCGLFLAVCACLPIWHAGAGLTDQQVSWLVRMPLCVFGGTSALVAAIVTVHPDM